MPYKDPEKQREYNRQNYERNKELRKQQQSAYRKDRRLNVLRHYSSDDPACSCCGESTYEFLVIDHIEGGGTTHRKQIKEPIERWLIRNNYPEGYRVLCENCNSSYGRFGYCPHKHQ